MTKNHALIVALLFAGLLVANVVSFVRLQAKADAAKDAAANLDECKKLAAQIMQARQTPLRAVSLASSNVEITNQIESAARGMNMPLTALSVIEPQPPKRIPETAYKIRTTRLELKQLPLSQVIALLQHILEHDDTLIVSSLRLSAPSRGNPSSDKAELWLPEVTLTNLIYDPTTPLPSK